MPGRYWYDLPQLVSKRLTFFRCIMLEDGKTPSNEPGFGDNDNRNCWVKGHLWRPELRHLQGDYE
jgi:hypothetical protein